MTMTLVALACLGLAAEFAAGVVGWSRTESPFR
jgi:hypothetical protein